MDREVARPISQLNNDETSRFDPRRDEILILSNQKKLWKQPIKLHEKFCHYCSILTYMGLYTVIWDPYTYLEPPTV
jgi:hypothetical protein